MNGRVARALRRRIYGAGMPHTMRYEFMRGVRGGQTLVCAGPRGAYQRAKREYKRLKQKGGGSNENK